MAGDGEAHAPVPAPVVRLDLGARQRRAVWRAPLWFAVGVAVSALVAAAAILLAVFGVARTWSLVTGERLRDAPVWEWLAPALAVTIVAVVVVLALVLGVALFWGAPRAIRREVGARVPQPNDPPVLRNVVDALALGLGVPAPELLLVDDLAPNALSVRAGRRRTVIATTGLATLPRPQVEAVLAHEMAHLFGPHTRWLTAASTSLGATRTLGGVLEAVGGVLAVIWGFAAEGGVMLWNTGATAVALFVLGAVVRRQVGRARRRLRGEQDEVADVAAIGLAGNPAALGQACLALAADARTIQRPSPRSDLLWFKAVTTVAEGSGDPPVLGDAPEVWRTTTDSEAGQELRRRAVHAYATAHVPLPGPAPTPTPAPAPAPAPTDPT